MRVFLKQYGAMRTGTTYLRSLLQSHYADVVPLMHILGDKHSPPAPFTELWRNAQTDPDPALAFVLHATTYAPALTTNLDDPGQRNEVQRVASRLAEAFRDGALGFVISSKNPYAWIVSYARYASWVSRHGIVPGHFVTEVEERCRELNAHYRSWIALERSAIVRHEDLIADPDATLARLEARFGLTRSRAFADITRETAPTSWDEHAPRSTGILFNRAYYEERRYLAQLTPLLRDAITRNIDWTLFEQLGYEPLPSRF